MGPGSVRHHYRNCGGDGLLRRRNTERSAKATRIWDRHDGFGMEYAQASLNKRKASVRADTGAYVQSFKRMFRASESRRSDLDYHSNN